jgi:D-threo-aldose 1-dehydrogenase
LLSVPRFGYGAANIGNLYRALTDEDAWAILEAAWSAGTRYFDTAPHYGLGLSEQRLGAFLATKPRDEFVLSTKVGRLLEPVANDSGALDLDHDFAVPADFARTWDFSADGIRRSLDSSLQRLGMDRVDILFLHDPEKHDLDAADQQAYPALIGLREEGLVSAVGVGSMSIPALHRAASNPDLDVLMVAGRLSLAEQPALEHVVPIAAQHGTSIVAAGVFNSGLLASNRPDAGARYEYGEVPEALLTRVRAIAAICDEFEVELPTAALQYPLRIPAVGHVIVGGSRPEQVAQNAARMSTPVPDALWSRLRTEGLIP